MRARVRTRRGLPPTSGAGPAEPPSCARARSNLVARSPLRASPSARGRPCACVTISARTEEVYLGPEHVTAFLNALATHRHVAASTQNQALAALLFLYRDVLGIRLPWLDDLVHAKTPAWTAHRA